MERRNGPMGIVDRTQGQGEAFGHSLGSVIKDRRGLSGSIPEVLGAIGIGVLLLGGTVFGVVAGLNFSKDSATKDGLMSVATGQTGHYVEHGEYGDQAQLTADAGYVASLGDNFEVHKSEDGTSFCAVGTSDSMSKPTFWVTSATGQKVLTTEPENCETGAVAPRPAALDITGVARSASAGTSFTVSGTAYREGASIAFAGGACIGQEGEVTATYQRTSPSALTSTETRTMAIAETNSFELAGVANGSIGQVSLSTSCVAGSESDSTSFTQALPTPALMGGNVDPSNIHNGGARQFMMWLGGIPTSLPTIAFVSLSEDGGPSRDMGRMGTATSERFYNDFPGSIPLGVDFAYSVVLDTGAVQSNPRVVHVSYNG